MIYSVNAMSNFFLSNLLFQLRYCDYKLETPHFRSSSYTVPSDIYENGLHFVGIRSLQPGTSRISALPMSLQLIVFQIEKSVADAVSSASARLLAFERQSIILPDCPLYHLLLCVLSSLCNPKGGFVWNSVPGKMCCLKVVSQKDVLSELPSREDVPSKSSGPGTRISIRSSPNFNSFIANWSMFVIRAARLGTRLLRFGTYC